MCERYVRLIESMLAGPMPPFLAEAETESTIQVERGLVLPMAIAGADPLEIERLTERLVRPEAIGCQVVDTAGQSRPPYPGLLMHAWQRAREIVGPREPERMALRTWMAGLHASGLADVVGRAWSRLAAGAHPLPDLHTARYLTGALLPEDPSENPETHWYRELVLLQALATHGSLRHDPDALAAADRAALYHLNETQPDHATAEPWGLLAFIHNPETHLLADQLLHTVQVQQPGGPRGVTRILLADTLLCLRNPPPPPG